MFTYLQKKKAEAEIERDAEATAEQNVQEEEEKEEKEKKKKGKKKEVAGEPRPESSPPEHKASWSFSGFFGPKPTKTGHEKYHNPSTYKPSGWEYIFGAASAPEEQEATGPS